MPKVLRMERMGKRLQFKKFNAIKGTFLYVLHASTKSIFNNECLTIFNAM